ncbi:MAG: glutamate--cysteine ligase [Thermoplasmata archaeon]|jgi:glutamate--cysteine ligase|nr:glutamate--cysteine ligase [Thermoplasmata archaeon]
MQVCDDLGALDEILVRRADHVEAFLAFHRDQVRCPVYTSVDVRRNAHKAAVVDANAFPAGFNNLAPRSRRVAADVARGYLARVAPGSRSALVVAESHTRNAGYFGHLAVLKGILEEAGYAVTLGTLSPDVADGQEMPTPTGGRVRLHRIAREGDKLVAGGSVADLVVLNNDLSEGVPPELQGIAQPITPPPAMGWHRRRKSEHFAIVAQMAGQLGRRVGFDPWLLTADFERVGDLDFKAKGNLDRAAQAIDRVVARVQAKYDEHGIRRSPAVFVKADAGTYGMAITTAASGADFLAGLNSRGREQMDRGKGRVKTTSVIVQESVPTDLRDGGIVAEPVIYMVCSRTVGGFYRAHGAKGDVDNLNSPGSRFVPLVFPGQGKAEPGEVVLDSCSAHVYAVLGEIASIATGYEAQFIGREPVLPHLPPRLP